jgi:uncharacterized membrane protein
VFEDHFIVLELWKVVELYGLHLLMIFSALTFHSSKILFQFM